MPSVGQAGAAGANNFLQWNPAKNNQENDAAYGAEGARLNGASGGPFPSNLFNKIAYQQSTFITALAAVLSAKGYNASDSDINALIASLSNIMTQNDLANGAYTVLNAAQSVANAVIGAVPWDNGYQTTQGWYDPSQPTKIIIPPGVNFVAVSAQAAWAANGTGSRGIGIAVNGNLVIGCPVSMGGAVPDWYTVQNLSANIYPVKAGDYFELWRYQSSGAALNFGDTVMTWLVVNACA
jgi:hypothetical protein